jgi:hypothetical protein
MAVYNTDCYMPLEMLDLIAAVDEQSYRAILAIPLFARSLTPGKVVDFMIGFGYSVRITKSYIEWYLNGYSHRVGGPAMEYTDGYKAWYLNGKLHRQARRHLNLNSKCEPDGPAVECANGHKEWWKDGKRHRVDGPAVEHVNGSKEWWLDDKLHRQARNSGLDPNGGEPDGPAIEYDGRKEWWRFGVRHRVDGPAIEYGSGRKEWWLNGIKQWNR